MEHDSDSFDSTNMLNSIYTYIAVLNAEIDHLKTKEYEAHDTDHIHITILTLQQRVKELKKDRVDND